MVTWGIGQIKALKRRTPSNAWECMTCTLKNEISSESCIVCHRVRGYVPQAFQVSVGQKRSHSGPDDETPTPTPDVKKPRPAEEIIEVTEDEGHIDDVKKDFKDLERSMVDIKKIDNFFKETGMRENQKNSWIKDIQKLVVT